MDEQERSDIEAIAGLKEVSPDELAKAQRRVDELIAQRRGAEEGSAAKKAPRRTSALEHLDDAHIALSHSKAILRVMMEVIDSDGELLAVTSRDALHAAEAEIERAWELIDRAQTASSKEAPQS
ncbi:MAG: hypothetical protein WDO56_35085 [Gammaproteobacteria bacterium]